MTWKDKYGRPELIAPTSLAREGINLTGATRGQRPRPTDAQPATNTVEQPDAADQGVPQE